MFLPFFFVFLSLTAFGTEAVPICPKIDGRYPVYIPHYSDCSKFYECSNGIPYLFDCPNGLHFNQKLNVCDWPNRADCSRQGSATPEATPEP